MVLGGRDERVGVEGRDAGLMGWDEGCWEEGVKGYLWDEGLKGCCLG